MVTLKSGGKGAGNGYSFLGGGRGDGHSYTVTESVNCLSHFGINNFKNGHAL